MEHFSIEAMQLVHPCQFSRLLLNTEYYTSNSLLLKICNGKIVVSLVVYSSGILKTGNRMTTM
jgi:hypothetical protein